MMSGCCWMKRQIQYERWADEDVHSLSLIHSFLKECSVFMQIKDKER
jgi:hypothetical protein